MNFGYPYENFKTMGNETAIIVVICQDMRSARIIRVFQLGIDEKVPGLRNSPDQGQAGSLSHLQGLPGQSVTLSAHKHKLGLYT
jgi:hypothetical protein